MKYQRLHYSNQIGFSLVETLFSILLMSILIAACVQYSSIAVAGSSQTNHDTSLKSQMALVKTKLYRQLKMVGYHKNDDTDEQHFIRNNPVVFAKPWNSGANSTYCHSNETLPSVNPGTCSNDNATRLVVAFQSERDCTGVLSSSDPYRISRQNKKPAEILMLSEYYVTPEQQLKCQSYHNYQAKNGTGYTVTKGTQSVIAEGISGFKVKYLIRKNRVYYTISDTSKLTENNVKCIVGIHIELEMLNAESRETSSITRYWDNTEACL